MKKNYIVICLFAVAIAHGDYNWHTINVDDMYFPKNFVWGTATAAHQVEGNCINNWSIWEKRPMTIKNNEQSGAACDHWNLYHQDIRCMKELGVNSYRFSVEWSKIEPLEGVFDDTALAHYRDVCQALVAAGITPHITVHHFTHPLWFEAKGAFEHSENTAYFVRFSKKVFEALHDLVPLWCTINEANTCAFQGYCTGMFAPGVKDPQRALVVMKNMIEAHVQVYHALKSCNAQVQIGFAHNITQFKAYSTWNPLIRIFCAIADHCFNTLIIEFIKTGVFSYHIPGFVQVHHENKQAIGALDFIGLNYYSHLTFDWQLSTKEPIKPRYKMHEIMTDLPYPLYPEGFYDAVTRVAQLGKPIYVTENGIADHSDDRRALFIRRYLYILSQAIKNGYDIRGYYYWSLMDNFEWCEGYGPKFGLYHVDFATQKRTLRPGAESFSTIVKRFLP